MLVYRRMWLNSIKAVAIDLDGVVYLGNRLVKGAIDGIKTIRDLGFKIFFITNNSGKTRAEVYEKLLKLGIKCDIADVYTS